MSVMDEPPEDIFSSIISGLEIEDPEDIIDVTKLSNTELLDLITDIQEELFEAGQALRPTTSWARDKHSLRNAAQIEVRKRSGGNIGGSI